MVAREGSRYWNLEGAIGKAVEESYSSEAVTFGKGTELLPICCHVGRELGKHLHLSIFPAYWFTDASQRLNPTSQREGSLLAVSTDATQATEKVEGESGATNEGYPVYYSFFKAYLLH